MTTYRAIASTETDPQAPLTASLMKALQSNPLAIQEGDPTAPKIQLAAFPGIVGNARVDHSGTTGAVVLLPYAGKWLTADLWSEHSAAHSLRIRTSTDGGATWSAAQNIATTAASGGFSGRLILNRLTGVWDVRGVAVGTAQRNTGTTAGTIDAVEFSCSVISALGRQWLHYNGQA